MTVSHETVMFDVHDCQVAALLSDSAGAIPTFGPWVDVPGISEVGLDPNFVTAELKGDARVIAKKGRIDRLNFSGTYSKLDLDVLAVLIGSTVSDITAVPAANVSVTTSNGSAIVTGTGFTPILAGRTITGTGIPSDTTVIAVNGAGTAMTLSEEATASATVTATVAAMGERARNRIQAPSSLPYFKIGFKIEDLDTGLGDLHVICYKAQITGGTLIGGSSDNFGQPSFDAECIGVDGKVPDLLGGYDDNVLADVDLLPVVTRLGS